MKTSFTPGPWYWKNQQNGSANLFAEDGARVILFDARLINREANARLIASSPTLLEACLLARDELQLISDENEGSHGKSLDFILEAINLATR